MNQKKEEFKIFNNNNNIIVLEVVDLNIIKYILNKN